ncbi:MAG: hypothetical protein NC400_08200 [Clostridium sp.]|nr:hypothetical protein [Clostridium sp.]
MEEGKVFLRAQEFNDWLAALEEENTGVKDRLHLLETEAGRLSEVWESSAGKLWEQELKRILGQAGECAAKVEALAGESWEKAERLAGMEKVMVQAAEAL